MSTWQQIILPALQGVLDNILGILPDLIGALVILLVGWTLATLLDRVVRRLLQRIGFNRLAERAGIRGFIRNTGFAQEPSWVVGKLIFWLTLLTFFLPAAEQLNLTAISLTLEKLVTFIPNLIAVVLMIIFGALFARLMGGITRGAAKEAGIEFADLLGRLVSTVILIIVVVMALAQLEIQSGILEIAFAALLGAFALAIALTLGLGTRTVAQNLVSGVYARRSFQLGQRIQVKGMQGEIVEIGTVNTLIRDAGQLISVPNSLLVEEIAISRDGSAAETSNDPGAGS